MKCAICMKDFPQMLPIKCRFIWTSGFRGEDFFKSTNQKQEVPVAAMFVNGSRQNYQSLLPSMPMLVNESARYEQVLQRTYHRCFLPSFGSFGQAVSEKNVFKLANQKQDRLLWLCLLAKRIEQPLQRTFHRCFLLGFGSFSRAVSEEKI